MKPPFQLDPLVIAMLGARGCLTRHILDLEPSTIEVCNIKRYRSHDERAFSNYYIGRNATERLLPGMLNANLGNPHPMAPSKCALCAREHTRKDCITEFNSDLTVDKHLQEAIKLLAVDIVKRNSPVKLWCFCAPLPCHGDVIARRLVKHLTHLEIV